ncbi:hypothetical protein AB0A74_07430 [Saccharothrix sp. NPDC042600]|uniref:hypothetical protein n=1 Tax=Saccharothrix TaxID=2071 RepID=UPI0033EEAB98|nr:hypothetical protein GCM10017745_29890 [Saccharothrix mutabilis subsp. capreolus]
MERVRDEEHARRLLKDLERDKPRHERPPDVAAPTGAGSADVVALGGDRIALDPAELAEALRRLDGLYDEIEARLGESVELERPFGDGRGPVARHMRAAFGLRGGHSGVQGALRSYLEELGALREALRQVGTTHQTQDEAVADTMRRK